MGIPTDRVPVIDVRGRLLLGLRRGAHRGAAGRTDMKQGRAHCCGARVARRRSLLAARAAEARAHRPPRRARTAGGMAGWGTTPNTPDFFEHTRGRRRRVRPRVQAPDLRFLRQLHADLRTARERRGTLTQFLLGTEIDIPRRRRPSCPNGQSRNVLAARASAPASGSARPGRSTRRSPTDQISRQGDRRRRSSVGYEYFFNPFIAVGAQGDCSATTTSSAATW